MIAVTLPALALAGCASSSAPVIAPVSRDIGPPPPDLVEVPVAEPRAGENVFVIAKRRGDGLDVANYRICRLREEWVRVRVEFLAGRSEVKPGADCVLPAAPAATRRSKGKKKA